MRIISGKHKGHRFYPPKKLPYRPTTDISKSGLFNILSNWWNFDNLKIIDLFSGTGAITYEFSSRGCEDIISIDLHPGCIKFLKENAAKLKMNGIKAMKGDVFKFLKDYNGPEVDMIFASPPYAINDDIHKISEIVFEKNMLAKHGWLIVETSHLLELDSYPYFSFKRTYGGTVFNFFLWEDIEELK